MKLAIYLTLLLSILIFSPDSHALDSMWNNQILKAKKLASKHQFNEAYVALEEAQIIAKGLGEKSDEYHLTLLEKSQIQYRQSTVLRDASLSGFRSSINYLKDKPKFVNWYKTALDKTSNIELGGLYAIGNVSFTYAEEQTQKSLSLIPKLKKWRAPKSILFLHLANIYRLKGEFAKEEESYLNYIKAIVQEVPSTKKDMSRFLERLGDIYRFQSKKRLAVKSYQEALLSLNQEPLGKGRPTAESLKRKITLSKSHNSK